MKIHYKIALALSALSAGFLVSCAKPSEPTDQNQQNQTANQTNPQTDNTAQTQRYQPYLTHVADTLIVPWYQDSLAKNQALQQHLQSSCQDGAMSGEALQALRQAWLALAQAWARAEVVNFGMATQDMGHLYINFFPDERNLIAKDVGELLRQNAITAQDLQDGSAIIQGIPAMEYVLFAHDKLQKNHCDYLLFASEILDKRLQNIVNDWQQNAHQRLSVGDVDVGVNQWFNSVLTLLEVSKTDALDKPLAITGNKKGHLPAKFAKQSKAMFVAKVEVLSQILTDPQLATLLGDPSLIHDGQKQLTATQDFLATLPDDLSLAKADEQQQLYEHFSQLTKWFKSKLMPAVGARVGFNGTDGD